MKQKLLYLIPPVIALGVFLFMYSSEKKTWDAHEVEATAKKTAADNEIKARKADADRMASEQMALKTRQRNEDEAKRIKARDDKTAADRRQVVDATKEARATAAKRGMEIMALQTQLDSLRKQRESLNRDYIEASKVVETLKADRRVALLEAERALAMISIQLQSNPILGLPAGWVPGSLPGSKGIPPEGFPAPKKGQNTGVPDDQIPDAAANMEAFKEKTRKR